MEGNREKTAIGRRQFIAGAAACGAIAAANAAQKAQAKKKSTPAAAAPQTAEPAQKKPLIASAPVLQNAAETSMCVVFAVNADASGWVECSESPDMANATRHYSGGGGMMEVDATTACIRVRGLKPATRYWYRIGADRIDYAGGYKMKNLGSETDGKVHSFTTLGEKAEGAFCVINDTHENKPTLDAVFKKLAELKPAVVVWNGDATNATETAQQAVGAFLRPHPDHPQFAADTPYMFVNGNHDFRGRFMRTPGRVAMYRDCEERKSEYASLGRNFVQRLGDIAMIALDTGEDKLDTNPKFAGIFRMKEYRELQTRWLAEAIETEAVKTAKFKVAFCHIPLYDDNPRTNPGDLSPADRAPGYFADYAYWQRTCYRMWNPLLAKAGVKLVVAAHLHRFRRYAPDADRPWIQLVGGGCDAACAAVGAGRPTVIEGRVEDGALLVRVHDAVDGKIVHEERIS